MVHSKHTRGIYHIHVDGRVVEPQLRQKFFDLGFVEKNFSGHPEGFQSFAPDFHVTLRLEARHQFDAAWQSLEAVVEQGEFVGYLEGEYIKCDDVIEERPYIDLPVPFQVTRRRLTGAMGEEFRQTELHLVMDRDASDPRLVDRLLRAGLYGVYMPKGDHVAVVLTAQGFIRDIGPLLGQLRTYLSQAGGTVRGTLKEERAIRHRLFGIAAADLPEIVEKVTV